VVQPSQAQLSLQVLPVQFAWEFSQARLVQEFLAAGFAPAKGP
jgi:hypothetical protein